MIDTNKTRRKPFPIALSLNDKPKAINLFSLLSPLSQSVHSTRIKKYEKHNLKLTKSPVKKL